jgi:hypothetical protein
VAAMKVIRFQNPHEGNGHNKPGAPVSIVLTTGCMIAISREEAERDFNKLGKALFDEVFLPVVETTKDPKKAEAAVVKEIISILDQFEKKEMVSLLISSLMADFFVAHWNEYRKAKRRKKKDTPED